MPHISVRRCDVLDRFRLECSGGRTTGEMPDHWISSFTLEEVFWLRFSLGLILSMIGGEAVEPGGDPRRSTPMGVGSVCRATHAWKLAVDACQRYPWCGGDDTSDAVPAKGTDVADLEAHSGRGATTFSDSSGTASQDGAQRRGRRQSYFGAEADPSRIRTGPVAGRGDVPFTHVFAAQHTLVAQTLQKRIETCVLDVQSVQVHRRRLWRTGADCKISTRSPKSNFL